MSRNTDMGEPHFDPGGTTERCVAPVVERSTGRMKNKDMYDASGGNLMEDIAVNMACCTLDSEAKPSHLLYASDPQVIQDRHELYYRDQSKDDVSRDSALGSMISSMDPSTTPMAEHTLDSIHPTYTLSQVPHPDVASLISDDQGYASSLCPSDFSSIGSSLASLDSGAVMYRENSRGASIPRPSSESPLPTSERGVLSARPGSWQPESAKEKLRVFAHKMNFSDREFEQSIEQLGVDGTNFDRLLNHLVKSRGSHATPQPKVSTNLTNAKSQSSSKSSTQPKSEGDSKGLRRIVIDGSNVAMEHGLHQIYSCRGIEITVTYFQMRGHEHITVFVPAHRLRTERLKTKDPHVLNELSRKGVVVKTPSRKSSKGHIASYEDRFILKLASMENAIVVSNDQFRDLKSESASFRETIEKRILPFVFANDQFIPAEDPLGKRGPTLEQFLRVDPYNAGSGTCPYGRKCTYGTKCKFGHPEREESYDSALGDSFKGPSSSSSQQSDYWPQPNRPMTFEQYNRTVAKTLMPPAVSYPPYFMMRSGSHKTVSNPLPNQYYVPRDHAQHPPTGRYAEYPPASVLPVPPAVRACLHEKSYRSLPQDDMQFQSRQPGHPSVTSTQESSTSSVQPQDTISSINSIGLNVGMPSMFSDLTLESSSQPQPLNEHLASGTSQYSTQSTRLAEGRQRQQHPYDTPILDTDPRYKIYFHLKELFPEKVVRRVMNKYPNEEDANKLTAHVLQMQSKVKEKVDC